MTFSFITLFPSIIQGYFKESILKRAIEKKIINIEVINMRDFAFDSYKHVDFAQIGGGAGQVLCPNVLDSALNFVTNKHSSKEENKPHIIFLTPNGKKFTQNNAINLAKKSHIVFVCGRYEGFDERAIEVWADECFCIGDFILTGGEIAALALSDAISRNIQNVLGNEESLKNESFENNLLEAPVFARSPNINEKIKKFPPISAYSKGNHSIISGFKQNLAERKTKFFRPDLFQKWKFQQRKHNEK